MPDSKILSVKLCNFITKWCKFLCTVVSLQISSFVFVNEFFVALIFEWLDHLIYTERSKYGESYILINCYFWMWNGKSIWNEIEVQRSKWNRCVHRLYWKWIMFYHHHHHLQCVWFPNWQLSSLTIKSIKI